jgi:hypothetical protein
MNETQLAAAAGILLSLAFSYVPGLRGWYDAKDAQTKALIMAGALLVISAGALGLSCTNWGTYFECSEVGLQAAIQVFVAALIANQAVYGLTKHIG